MMRSLILAILTTLALASASTLTRRAGLVPHVSNTTIDIFPSGGGAYPRLAPLASGAILGSATEVSGADKVLRVTRSTDGGATFADLGSIARSPGDLDNAVLLELAPGGAVLAAFRNHDYAADGTTYAFYRLTATVSHDGGATWSFLSQIAQRAATETKNGLWEPFLRLSKKDGSIQVYYASENSGTDQDILMQTSKDGGATWSVSTPVAGATTTGRDGMPGCANFNDGTEKLMCVFETTEGRGSFSVKSVVSPDEGVSWEPLRSIVYAPTDATKNAGAPQIVAPPDGNLVVSFMTDEDNSAVHTWPDGASFKILTSPPVGDGSGWGHETVVTGIPSSWPGMLAKSDGSVLSCAGHAAEGAVCHAVTFTPS